MRLLRKDPYTITPVQTGSGYMKITINQLSGLSPGDQVYQVQRDDGIIELIPKGKFKEYWGKN